MSAPPREIEVFRYRPDVEEESTWERYSVPCHPDDTLLDVLHRIKEDIDPTLSYRWSCGMGVCGSCGVSVDGTPLLACTTRAAGLAKTARVAPLANFSVIRDLVVELDDFRERLRAAKPWLVGAAQPPAAEPPQTPAQVAAYAGLAACIQCGLCDAACPALSHQPDFLGPASIALAWRYALDPHDHGEAQRHPVLAGRRGVWSCTQSQACSKVCPQGVDPAQAVQRSQLATALRALGAKRAKP